MQHSTSGLWTQVDLKKLVWTAADSTDAKDFRSKHGSDLFMTDIDEYDRICKVGNLGHVAAACT